MVYVPPTVKNVRIEGTGDLSTWEQEGAIGRSLDTQAVPSEQERNRSL